MAVKLGATEYGAGEPVVILHGLFGFGRNWATIAQRLGAHHRVIAFDLRNHGASPWTDTMDYAAMAQDVAAAMAERGYRHYALIGHSMGGKVAMAAALSEPDKVTRLVVVDIAPIAYPVPYLGYVRALRDLDLTAIVRRRDADAALAAAIPDATERTFLLQNLVLGDGPPHWRLNLTVLEAALPQIADFPIFASGSAYRGPTLFIAGGRSRALRPEHETTVKALFPVAEIARIENAGHWVQAEQPEAFLALVEPFLAGSLLSSRIWGDAD